jgi:hypothetical protein
MNWVLYLTKFEVEYLIEIMGLPVEIRLHVYGSTTQLSSTIKIYAHLLQRITKYR